MNQLPHQIPEVVTKYILEKMYSIVFTCLYVLVQVATPSHITPFKLSFFTPHPYIENEKHLLKPTTTIQSNHYENSLKNNISKHEFNEFLG